MMMIEAKRRLDAFVSLGRKLDIYLERAANEGDLPTGEFTPLTEAISRAYLSNNWFTIENQLMALRGIRHILDEEKLGRWMSSYDADSAVTGHTVAVIMAGNIPAVGFHDFLCVLVSGQRFLGKLSSDDRHLMPALAEMLISIEPGFKDFIAFSEGQIKHFDAVIATGSDNSARYFDYYFGRYPHIIRHNRNSIGIVSGKEQTGDLSLLADDIFSYFGLGCRSVSHLLLPQGYDPESLFEGFEAYRPLRDHHKYFNNYEYHKAVSIINRLEHHDNGFVILMPDSRLSSPVSVVHFSFYGSEEEVQALLDANSSRLQCVVSQAGRFPGSIPFGKAQFPSVDDYADDLDTMQFLLQLGHSIKK